MLPANPSSPAPLQFDTAVPAVVPSGDAAVQGVTCAVCHRVVNDEYFEMNGLSVCAGCRDELEQLASTPRGWRLFFKAGAFGLGAAILGAILYYAVIAITNFEIGVVAIAIGYMVGWAIRRATGSRGGRRYQVMAVVLTYWAVGLAYTPIAFREAFDESKSQQTQGTAEATQPALAESSPGETEDGPVRENIPLVFVVLLGFTVVLPVLVVMGSMPGGLLSALIIGIGMHQAWKMTGMPAMEITGPFRIAAAPPSAAV